MSRTEMTSKEKRRKELGGQIEFAFDIRPLNLPPASEKWEERQKSQSHFPATHGFFSR